MQAVCKSIATSTVQSLIESVRGKDLVETPQGDKQAKASRDSLSALVGECSRVTNGTCLTIFEDWNFESTVFANTRFLCLCGVLNLIQVREVLQAMTLYLHLSSCQNY